MSNLILSAPIGGWAAPLGEVPDPVFAGGLIGDGVAIDPLDSVLRAPCDGVILSLHEAGHAVLLRAGNGAELLLHVGVDTVRLGGQGFAAEVRAGQAVKVGDPLIRIDLDDLAGRARSLMTPMIVTNSEAFRIVRRRQDCEMAAGEFLMELAPTARESAQEAAGEGPVVRRELVVAMAHGLHARPSATLAERARRHDCKVWIDFAGRRANAKSATAVMALGVGRGAHIAVAAEGVGAEAAAEDLSSLVASGMGEAAPPVAAAVQPQAALADAFTPGVLRGVKAAPGVAIGPARWVGRKALGVPETAEDPAFEDAALVAALARARARLERLAGEGESARAAILQAHVEFLCDPELIDRARRLIAQGAAAAYAWRRTLRDAAEPLLASPEPRVQERAADLGDVAEQVVRILLGDHAEAAEWQGRAILLADDLAPSELAALGPERVAGVCAVRGGPTSHMAIIAQSIGVPALVAIGPGLESAPEGAELLLDADAGFVRVDGDVEALMAARAGLEERRTRLAEAAAQAHRPAQTSDGVRIEVFANLGSLADAELAAKSGAEGCGLLRTEFLFLERATPPDVEEQRAAYQAIADAMAGRPMVVRTLDIGADKPAPYLPLAAEENPALGLRGVRVGLAYPELLRTQLRALLSVRPIGKIMAPMVSDVGELRAVRRLLDEARGELGVEAPVELGVMVETPAAALCADVLAAEADFLSIGTNDLTQYVLAMDRGAASLADRVDAYHPAVLRLIGQTCEGAARRGRWVGVCGGLASDPMAAALLIGLGVTELSAAPAAVAEVKASVRAASLADCQDLARRALAADGADEVRRLARDFQERN